MSKFTRFTQKLFGGNAGLNQIAEFGSLANSSPTFTTDPNVIQSLAAWTTGWFGAVIGGNSPAIEDMNAVFYQFCYVLCYLLQEGVAEYDSGTTYYTNSLANYNGVLYISQIDNNLGNTPSPTVITNWRRVLSASVGAYGTPATVGGSTAVPLTGIEDENIYVVGNNAITSRTASQANVWNSVAWSPTLQLFASVSSTGTNRVMTSPDGVTWTNRTASSARTWSSVCWSPQLSLFVAVSKDASQANQVMTSPDGLTWSGQSGASTGSGYASVAWSPSLELFVAVGFSVATGYVMTSPDSVTWTARSPASNAVWNSVTWSSTLGLFVAVGGNSIMWSYNGTAWTTAKGATSFTGNSFSSVVWADTLGLFVAVSSGNETHQVWTSPDGILWTAQTQSGSHNWQSISWSTQWGLLIAFPNDGGNIAMTSPDGVNWTNRTCTTDGSAYQGSTWSPDLSLFVAVASSGTHQVASLAPATITANPEIAAGTIEGQKLRIVGTDDLAAPLINSGNGSFIRKSVYLKKNTVARWIWNNAQSLWIAD